MKTRTQKGKTEAMSLAVPAKKSGLKKTSFSPDSKKKPKKKAAKRSSTPPEDKKKPGTKKKTIKEPAKEKGKLPSDTTPVAKKIESASRRKPAGVRVRALKKTAATPKTTARTSAKKKSSLKKKGRASGKKAILINAPVTGKLKGRIPEGKDSIFGNGEDTYDSFSDKGLPREYGENELIVMAVDPNVVFVDWEIRKKEIKDEKESLTMRVFDVTGGGSSRFGGNIACDLKIEGRIGCGFFELRMPGRKIAIEIGLYENGKFLPVLRCPAVLIPRLPVSDELGILEKMFGSSSPVGY